jgi:hypothetical protein
LHRTSPPVDPTAPTFHPVSSNFKPSELFGELEPKDTEWLCAGGFVTETQIFYNILEDGTSLMCQVIYSSIGCAPSLLVSAAFFFLFTNKLM